MVAVGLTLTLPPLEMLRLPGVITPDPLPNTAVSELLEPELMDAGFAVKLVM